MPAATPIAKKIRNPHGRVPSQRSSPRPIAAPITIARTNEIPTDASGPSVRTLSASVVVFLGGCGSMELIVARVRGLRRGSRRTPAPGSAGPVDNIHFEPGEQPATPVLTTIFRDSGFLTLLARGAYTRRERLP